MNIPIVFQHGIKQDADKRVLPAGWFRTANNVRLQKDGRMQKRTGFTQRTSSYHNAAGSFLGPIQALGTLGLTNYAIHDSIVWGWNGTYWDGMYEQNQDALSVISRWEPVRRRVVAIDENRSASYCSSIYATAGGLTYRFTAWSNNNGLFVRCEQVVTDITVPDNQTVGGVNSVVFEQRVDGGGTATEPRMIANGDGKAWVYWRDGTNIKAASCTLASIGGQFGAAATLYTTITAAAGYDVANGSGSLTVMVFQSDATHVKIVTLNGTTELNNTTFLDASGGSLKATVGLGSDSGVGQLYHLAWLTTGTGHIRGTTCTTGLTLKATVIDISALATNTSRPGLVTKGDHTFSVTWGGVDTGQPRLYVADMNYASGGPTVSVTTTFGPFYEMRPVSKPLYVDSRLYVWACSGRTGSLQAAYHLMEPKWINGRSHGRTAYGTATYIDHAETFAPLSTGYSWAYPEIFRGLASGTPALGITAIQWIPSVNRPNRATAMLGGSLHIAGGFVAAWDGVVTTESGFAWAPEILSANLVAGGALTALAVYKYVVVYEWVDKGGNRYQSAPSLPSTVTLTAGNQTVALTFTALDSVALKYSSSETVESAVAHVYRTAGNGRIYTRVTPDVGAPAVAKQAGGVGTYTDAASDASVAANESLYTQGGLKGNVMPPACGHLWAGKGRLCASRLENRRIVQWSKVQVPGEPIQWASEDSWQARVDDDVECAAEMDGVWYVFSADAIWAIGGDGPDDKGVGSFAEPVRVAGYRGCIDWRSLVSTPEGLMFQARDGLYLLPRGGGAPVWAGEPIQDLIGIGTTIVGARWDPNDNTVIWSLGTSYVVLILKVNEWVTDTMIGTAQSLGTWTGALAVGTDSGTVMSRQATYLDQGLSISATYQTGEITPFGLGGYGRVRKVYIQGEYRSDATLTATAYYDGGATVDGGSSEVAAASMTASWQLTSGNYAVGDRFELEWDLYRQKLSSLSVKFVDGDPTIGTGGEGCVLHGMVLAGVDPKRGAAKRPAGSRV